GRRVHTRPAGQRDASVEAAHEEVEPGPGGGGPGQRLIATGNVREGTVDDRSVRGQRSGQVGQAADVGGQIRTYVGQQRRGGGGETADVGERRADRVPVRGEPGDELVQLGDRRRERVAMTIQRGQHAVQVGDEPGDDGVPVGQCRGERSGVLQQTGDG